MLHKNYHIDSTREQEEKFQVGEVFFKFFALSNIVLCEIGFRFNIIWQ